MSDTSARLLRLLSLLQARRDWPGDALAERLAVSARTVRRDVDRLRELGYPVRATKGPDGGYRLDAGADLPPLLFDDEQAVAVAVALQTATGSVVGIEEGALRALATVRQVMPARLRHRIDALQVTAVARDGADRPRVNTEHLISIGAAVRAHEVLRFDYETPNSTGAERAWQPPRRAEPHHLVTWGSRWYLICWDLDRNDWRTFRVDRMTPKGPNRSALLAARTARRRRRRLHRRGVPRRRVAVSRGVHPARTGRADRRLGERAGGGGSARTGPMPGDRRVMVVGSAGRLGRSVRCRHGDRRSGRIVLRRSASGSQVPSSRGNCSGGVPDTPDVTVTQAPAEPEARRCRHRRAAAAPPAARSAAAGRLRSDLRRRDLRRPPTACRWRRAGSRQAASAARTASPAGRSCGRVGAGRQMSTERNRDVLPVHQDVGEGLQAADSDVALAGTDHSPDRSDQFVGRRGGTPARGVVDHPVHSSWVPDDLGQRLPWADLLQGQVRSDVTHRSAFAQRRLRPLLVVQVLEQRSDGQALFVDRVPRVVEVHDCPSCASEKDCWTTLPGYFRQE